MKQSTILLVLLGGLLLCFSSCSANRMMAEKEAIRTVCEKQVDAWRMQDYAAEKNVWAQTPYIMKMLTNGTRTIGWKKISEQYETSFANRAQDFEPTFTTHLSDYYIHVKGKTAWVIFDQHQVFPDAEGNNQLYETLEFRCLEKIDGTWQIVLQLTGPYDNSGEVTIVENTGE